MAQAFFGGVHPHDMKAATNEKAIEQLAPPATVVIPMSMHFGAPCTPIVKVGDQVKVGQKIGEFKGLGAPIHASVSGTVKAIEPRPYSMGGDMMSVVIENDFQNTVSEEVKAPADPDALTVEEMVEIVKNAGIVGMGGATFPTHVKISGGIGKVTDVIINGAECEPYITGDHRAMLERTADIIGGATYLAKMFGVDKVTIGVEDNKKNGIDALNKVIAEKKAPVVVEALRCRYPQGGEKQLIQAITGRQVPSGGLPAAVGCAVFNSATCKAIHDAVYLGQPLIRRIVTVSGDIVMHPMNLMVPIGTSFNDLLEAVGHSENPYKVLSGGPMMGVAQFDLSVPVTKGTNAVTILGRKNHFAVHTPHCIRCGKCMDVCPMHLMPLMMYQAERSGNVPELQKLGVLDCIECGCCAYTCPATIPLVQSFRAGKQRVRNAMPPRKG